MANLRLDVFLEKGKLNKRDDYLRRDQTDKRLYSFRDLRFGKHTEHGTTVRVLNSLSPPILLLRIIIKRRRFLLGVSSSKPQPLNVCTI